jgi:hypothetical protein
VSTPRCGDSSSHKQREGRTPTARITALANELRVLVDIYGADVELCVDGADDPEYKKESKRRAK